MHNETIALAGWSEAAHGDQSAGRKCRLGHVVGLMSFTLSGPRHIPRWTSGITRKLVEMTLGGDLYAIGEIVDTSLRREFCGPLADSSRWPLRPHEARKDYRGGIFVPKLPEDSTVVGNCGIGQRVLAPGLSEQSDKVPIIRLLEPKTFRPGILRPLRGMLSKEREG